MLYAGEGLSLTFIKRFGNVIASTMQTRNPSHRIILAIVLVSFIAAPSAFAAWVWSPQTGWVGPGGAVKDSPQEQLVFAVAFFDRKDYEKARGEFKKLLR
ncbi:MAG: hypothetical protein HYY57_03655, partial [Candidatus Omnitrophica bacterium]|nr:hypothetical protein [Candidatus Omnitrophota bacterium]